MGGRRTPPPPEWTKSERKKGWVYAIRNPNTGAVKIGFSTDVDQRLRDLQTGAGVRLELVGKVQARQFKERVAHWHLKKYKVHGEWFKLPFHMLRNIECGHWGKVFRVTDDYLWYRHRMKKSRARKYGPRTGQKRPDVTHSGSTTITLEEHRASLG